MQEATGRADGKDIVIPMRNLVVQALDQTRTRCFRKLPNDGKHHFVRIFPESDIDVGRQSFLETAVALDQGIGTSRCVQRLHDGAQECRRLNHDGLAMLRVGTHRLKGIRSTDRLGRLAPGSIGCFAARTQIHHSLARNAIRVGLFRGSVTCPEPKAASQALVAA